MARRPKQTAAPARKEPGPPVEPEPPPRPVAPDRGDWAAGAVVAALAAILYGMTFARDLVLGDTPELMTAAATLGVAHPPGYPLLTMLGHLFSLLPFGTLPLRLNLLAVVCGVGTIWLVYLTALRVSGSRAASACAALVLASTPLVWSWSLVFEVFSLNNLLAAAMIYLLAIWHDWPERTGFLSAAALVSGLALANHQTIVLVGPAVVFLLWRRRRVLLARPRALAASAAAFLAGLLPYAYLPWAAARHPAWNWGNASTLANFLAVVTRRDYGSGQLISEANCQGGSAIDRVLALGASFGVLAGLLLLLGAVERWRRRRWYFWFSLLAFGFAGPFFVAYAHMDVSQPLLRAILERFYLLAQVVLAPLMAFGVLLAAEWLARTAPRIHVHANALAAAAAIAAALGVAIAHYAEIDQSRNHTARRFAEDILATLQPNSILPANGDELIMPLAYLLYVEHYRADVSLMSMSMLRRDWYCEQLRRQYSNLTIPFPRDDGRSGAMRALFDANAGRPIAVDGIANDDSLKDRYWFYRRGLVAEVEPVSRQFKMDQMVADNERLLSRYRPPAPREIKWKSLEPSILDHYATPTAYVGVYFQQFGYNQQAAEWYRRALALDPSSSKVREMLAQLPQEH